MCTAMKHLVHKVGDAIWARGGLIIPLTKSSVGSASGKGGPIKLVLS